MSYDWFVNINEEYKSMFLKIAKLDAAIKNNERDKKEILKKERKNLWNETWKIVCETIPFYSFQAKMISSVSFEQESLQDILRERYIEMIYTEKNQISNCLDQLTSLYEIFKTPKINNLNDFPLFSFFLQFTFTLAKPYLSKDDETFYICDNPIRKDKVFKVPIVSGSTWKGNMRWTARQVKELNPDKSYDKVIIRLFGNEKKEERAFCRGRLSFYPTFFDKISLEVINPHDRKTKAGTVPIYIESVPEGATGTFSLLYVPFDLMGKPAEEIKQQVTEDINLVYDSLKEMMLTYGFSAKKSSGFGIIDKDIKEVIFEMPGYTDKEKLLAPKPTRGKISYSFKEFTSPNQTTNQANSSRVSSFSKMRVLIEQVKEEVMKSVK